MDRNIAVVGCGYWGKNLVRNFAALGALHTICDSNSEVLSKLAPLYQNVKEETNLDTVLTDKEIKGVVIALPATLHYPAARQALLAGKDVFVEKPITSKSLEAQELVELAEKRNRILMVGHLMLYHPAVPLLKHHIQSGDLGEIYYLYSTRVNLGQVRRDESALWRLTPHDISLFLYLLGALPETVSAHGIGYLQPNLEDVVFITLKFPKNILAHIHASWLDPHKTRQITVVGSKKMAVFDDMELEHKLRIYNKGVVDNYDTILASSGVLPLRSEEVFISQVDLAEPLFLECQHFIHCIEEQQQPLTDGRSGYQVIKILEAAEKSLRNYNKTVKVH